MAPRATGMLEKHLEQQVRSLATVHGWRLQYHTWNSRHSPSGFPDLVLVRRERIVFSELKRLGQEPTEKQEEWLDGLAIAGAEVYLWRPDDFRDIEIVLSSKKRPTMPLASRWLPPTRSTPRKTG